MIQMLVHNHIYGVKIEILYKHHLENVNIYNSTNIINILLLISSLYTLVIFSRWHHI